MGEIRKNIAVTYKKLTNSEKVPAGQEEIRKEGSEQRYGII